MAAADDAASAVAAGGDIAAETAASVVVLDFGSQYTQLIARRIRELGVYSYVLPWAASQEEVMKLAPRGIILSGGPETVTEHDGPSLPAWLPKSGLPVLGICYGMQAMVKHFGGRVEADNEREFGAVMIQQTAPCPLLDGIEGLHKGGELPVWASHGDRVVRLPKDFSSIASSANAPITAIQSETLSWYGLQFHPEVTHTPAGSEILSRFLTKVCGCSSSWNLNTALKERIEAVRRQIGDSDQVLLGISGGVDSAVTAALLSRAIGNRLICVLVDNGLMRKNEIKQVAGILTELKIRLQIVDAADIFLRHLRNVSDPERKRKVIGATFIDIFELQAKKCGDIPWLAQGTIYSDVIESARTISDAAHLIKSHHNVGGLPERMNLKLVEPLRDLFKDEVRELGKKLGLPASLLCRHPFPGPGLAVRLIGCITREKLDLLREADAIFMDELKKADLYKQVSQAFAVLLPVNSVGVVGDQRRYAPVLALRAVESVDFMTARWAQLPWDFIDRVASRILNNLSGISRVVYDVSSKPPATIEWE